MTVGVTPEVLRASYSLLKLTRPFIRMKLPPVEDVIFKVLRTADKNGDWSKDSKGRHVIRVSQVACHTLETIIKTVAHEMCHMLDDTRATHGWKFRRLADQVCKHHNFDRGQF